MEEVIRTYRPRVFLDTDSSHTTPHYLRLIELVRDSGMQAIFPTDAPRQLELGSVLLTVLPQPPRTPATRTTTRSGFGSSTGPSRSSCPATPGPREGLVGADCPDLIRVTTVLKLAHHGSKNGTDARWLDLVRPRLAVASVGRDNEFGHPGPQTLALLERRGSRCCGRTGTGRSRSRATVGGGGSWAAQAPRGPPVAGRAAHAPSRESRAKPARESPGARSTSTRRRRTELEALPGVGPVIARRIIEGRPYRSVDDLDRVKGIGKKRLDEIRSLVTVK